MGVLTDLLGGDPQAPVYVIRLWSHCNMKKGWQFPELPADILRAICKAGQQHKPGLFFDSMMRAGFVAENGSGFDVPTFAEHNAQLLANWINGPKGGRPTKNNPVVNPGANQSKTQGLTDKRRGDKKKTPAPPYVGAPPLPAEPAPPPAPPPEKKPVKAPEPIPAPTPAPAPHPPAATPIPAAPEPSAPPPLHRALPTMPDMPGVSLFATGGAKAPAKQVKTTVDVARAMPLPDWMPRDLWQEVVDYRQELQNVNKNAPFTQAAFKSLVRHFDECRAAGNEPRQAFDRMAVNGWRRPFPEADQVQRISRSAGSSRRDDDIARANELAGNPSQKSGEKREAHQHDVIDVPFRDHPRTDDPD